MLWAQRSTRTFLEELMNHKVWECKDAKFKITYVHSVSLQSSLIKLGNELQQRMQDRRLRGHEHRHMSNNDIQVLWCKKSLFPQYWLMDQTYTKKRTEVVNWETNFLNILTWQQTGTNIYIYTMNVTHRVMEGKAMCPHLYSLKVQNCLQTSCLDNGSYSDFGLPLWVVQRNTLLLLTFLWLSTMEVSSFNLCCTKLILLFQNNLNCSKKNDIFLVESSLQEGSVLKQHL